MFFLSESGEFVAKKLGKGTKFWLAVVCKEILDADTLEEVKFNVRSLVDVNNIPVERIKVIRSGNGIFYSE